ncbi:hypothetical protein AaE_015447 [Aphanomyces astaci]|uniref:DDE Tnp4 domain-containing protein n=1 Tax=Aphanomyces astaci TaxID=112090 RepID=A0A6A4YZK7_APHAT|nr:hypothetical protein AaE_015447 [Aphanomyces astaci]
MCGCPPGGVYGCLHCGTVMCGGLSDGGTCGRRDVYAVLAGSIAAAAVCIAMSSVTRTEKYNLLTVTEIDFQAFLVDPVYDRWFMDNLRCNQVSFVELCELLRVEMAQYSLDNYTKSHSYEKKVAVVLYFLGSQGGYREVAAVFGMSKSWCQNIVHIFAEVLAGMASSWIHLPTSDLEWQQVELGFRSNQNMSGIVGDIDGTLIEIQRPKDYDGFYNRHGDPSLNVQAMVDHTGAFTSVDIRPGSFSDRRIWKMSTLGRTFRTKFPCGSYIIGDSGYALFPWLIVPYLPHEEPNKTLSSCQRHFNYIHSSTRMVVECAFGRLKERFRMLKIPMSEKSMTQTSRNVMACMVLHNILLRLHDPLFNEPDSERDRNIYCQPEPYVHGRTPVETSSVLRSVGRFKRDRIAQTLFKMTNE